MRVLGEDTRGFSSYFSSSPLHLHSFGPQKVNVLIVLNVPIKGNYSLYMYTYINLFSYR